MESLQDVWLTLQRLNPATNPLALADILMVSLIIYALLYFMRGTPVVQLIRGILVLVVILFFLSSFTQLTALRWLIRNATPALFFAIPVIFQPEIRRGLERLGRGSFFFGRYYGQKPTMAGVVQEVAQAAKRLSERRYGALIVFERSVPLQDIIETGMPIDSAVTAELLITIFYPGTPLHDGAVIIRDQRIVAAACVLPLAAEVPDPQMGTRHRAALGVTEQTDALAVVVSEETGQISLAYSGRIIRNLDEGRLTRLLLAFYEPRKREPTGSKPKREPPQEVQQQHSEETVSEEPDES